LGGEGNKRSQRGPVKSFTGRDPPLSGEFISGGGTKGRERWRTKVRTEKYRISKDVEITPRNGSGGGKRKNG